MIYGIISLYFCLILLLVVGAGYGWWLFSVLRQGLAATTSFRENVDNLVSRFQLLESRVAALEATPDAPLEHYRECLQAIEKNGAGLRGMALRIDEYEANQTRLSNRIAAFASVESRREKKANKPEPEQELPAFIPLDDRVNGAVTPANSRRFGQLPRK